MQQNTYQKNTPQDPRPLQPEARNLTHKFPSPPHGEGGITLELLKKYQELCALTQHEWHVTSGYRTIEHNRLIGGAAHSAHCRGLALDIAVIDDWQRYELVHALINLGVLRLGLYKRHVHFDLSTSPSEHVIWLSNSA